MHNSKITPYYDSEEEIAWGPRTLQEIKGDFKRTRKVKRRHTEVHMNSKDFEMDHNIHEIADAISSKCNISNTSEPSKFFTPNETQLSTKSNETNKNTATDGSYASALDYTYASQPYAFGKIAEHDEDDKGIDVKYTPHKEGAGNYRSDHSKSIGNSTYFTDEDVIILDNSNDENSINLKKEVEELDSENLNNSENSENNENADIENVENIENSDYGEDILVDEREISINAEDQMDVLYYSHNSSEEWSDMEKLQTPESLQNLEKFETLEKENPENETFYPNTFSTNPGSQFSGISGIQPLSDSGILENRKEETEIEENESEKENIKSGYETYDKNLDTKNYEGKYNRISERNRFECEASEYISFKSDYAYQTCKSTESFESEKNTSRQQENNYKTTETSYPGKEKSFSYTSEDISEDVKVLNREKQFSYDSENEISENLKNNSLSSSAYDDLSNLNIETLQKRMSSPINVEINMEQFNDSMSLDYGFNDTLEEMEKALKEGLDYSTSDKCSVSNNSIISGNCITSESYKSPYKFDNSHNLSNESVKSNSSSSGIPKPVFYSTSAKKQTPNKDFKIPKPLTKAKLPLKMLGIAKNYTDVISPVRIYIKNSPQTILKQNMKPTKSNTVSPRFSYREKSKNNECIVPSIPERIYKPAMDTRITKESNIRLPSSIQKLVKESTVVKHQGRLNKNQNEFAVHNKLLKNDLTGIDDSIMNSTSNMEISILTSKQGYIK